MEADSDSAAWSHWIQDAEPDMLRGKHCFSCTSASKWDADHPCELQATKAESLTWRSILCTAACSPARPTTIAYDCGRSLKAIREKQANRLEFASATRTQYCECLGIARVKFWLQVRMVSAAKRNAGTVIFHIATTSFLQLRLTQQLSCGVSHPRKQALVQGRLMATSSKHCRYLVN